jgi:hypothetical protein
VCAHVHARRSRSRYREGKSGGAEHGVEGVENRLTTRVTAGAQDGWEGRSGAGKPHAAVGA